MFFTLLLRRNLSPIPGHISVNRSFYSISDDSYKQKVTRLEISVDNICGVHEKKPSKYLVDKVLDMVVAKILARVDDPMQVRFHEVGDDIDICVIGPGFRFEDVQ